MYLSNHRPLQSKVLPRHHPTLMFFTASEAVSHSALGANIWFDCDMTSCFCICAVLNITVALRMSLVVFSSTVIDIVRGLSTVASPNLFDSLHHLASHVRLQEDDAYNVSNTVWRSLPTSIFSISLPFCTSLHTAGSS